MSIGAPSSPWGFHGGTAVVVGGARGIGRAVAFALADECAQIVLLDHCANDPSCDYEMPTEADLNEVSERCARRASVTSSVVDIADAAATTDVMMSVLRKVGAPDVIAVCAGVLGPVGAPLVSVADDQFDRVLHVNVAGVANVCRPALSTMVESRRGGAVTVIGSTGSRVAFREMPAYVASKHALVGLVKSIAVDYGRHGIRANLLSPTVVWDTESPNPMAEAVASGYAIDPADYRRALSTSHPFRRLPTSDDIARWVLWLSSPMSSPASGLDVVVDGGFTAQ